LKDGTYDAMPDSQYIQDLDDIYKGFTHYLRCPRFVHDMRYEVNVQQSFFIKGMINQTTPGNIYKLEHLDSWFADIQKLFKTDVPLPVVNRVQRDNDWKTYYNDESREIVTTRYSQDIQNFNYSWDDDYIDLDRNKVEKISGQFSPLPEQGVA